MTAIDTGDTAWVLASAALVLWMTPGLAFFYGGMVRGKNVLATIMASFVAIALVSVQWVVVGYALAFGPDVRGLVGNLAWAGLRGVGLEAGPYAATIPHLAFMAFQMTFAIITPALVSGAVAERMRFPAWCAFVLVWATLVYDPICHWVWGGGWLAATGALDFAGGTVVHISSGAAALAAALVLGPRRGFPGPHLAPHNLPFTILGAGVLWFGWFGFNAGSALGASALAASAFVTTNTAAAAATLGWLATDVTLRGRPTALGAASGAVAGLVGVTPAAGFVTPMGALAIGLAAGVVCNLAVTWRARTGLDDSLDVVGVHGVGGTLGALATGLLATKAVNAAGADGLLYGGGAGLLGAQALGAVASAAYSFFVTFAILKVIDAVVGLRVPAEDEETGLDISEHGERAYA